MTNFGQREHETPMDTATPSTFSDWAFALVALILTNATTASIVTWLTTRKKTGAETVQITAQSVKIEAEAREIATRTIIEAQNRIVELADINADLQRENVEAVRKADNFEFELLGARGKITRLEEQIILYEAQLDKYRAAEKLDQVLDKLPRPT